jgi:hypothetical protein
MISMRICSTVSAKISSDSRNDSSDILSVFCLVHLASFWSIHCDMVGTIGSRFDRYLVKKYQVWRLDASYDGLANKSEWATSSTDYINVTSGASWDMYTAPADGWMDVPCTTPDHNAYIIREVILNAEPSVGVYGSG